jgi:peptidyl-prolyl cis-trans isomerase B (cyclophilin B)
MANVKKEVAEENEKIDFDKYSYQVHFATNLGDIKLELWPEVAPKHCRNILSLSKIGFYDGLSIHRIIPGFVIQGGCPDGNGTGGPGYNVDAEFNDRLHEEGVLSMARSSDPNSAGSQFFICLGRAPHLDKQYTAFGKTMDETSIETLRSMAKIKTGGGDKPLEAVTITKASVTESAL